MSLAVRRCICEPPVLQMWIIAVGEYSTVPSFGPAGNHGPGHPGLSSGVSTFFHRGRFSPDPDEPHDRRAGRTAEPIQTAHRALANDVFRADLLGRPAGWARSANLSWRRGRAARIGLLAGLRAGDLETDRPKTCVDRGWFLRGVRRTSGSHHVVLGGDRGAVVAVRRRRVAVLHSMAPRQGMAV